MTIVTFTLQKKDGTNIQLEYVPFDNLHSKLWVKGLVEQRNILWGDRVYNLTDPIKELRDAIVACNSTINQLNFKYNLSISEISTKTIQHDINHAHTFFVDAIKCELWHTLNYQLHGIEILERNKNKKLQGQIFVELENKTQYDIPEESFKYFTTRKKTGYCYANYSHVGRHILEMYNAQDDEAHDEHVIPMHKISGSSYLWFGKTTNWFYDKVRMFKIKQWFMKNNIQNIVGMAWGNPKLAIGWLPVAKLVTPLKLESLIGCVRVINIELSREEFVTN